MRICLVGSSDAYERLTGLFSIFFYFCEDKFIQNFKSCELCEVLKCALNLFTHIHSYFSSTTFASEMPLGT